MNGLKEFAEESQWNPRRSRGASVMTIVFAVIAVASQWNPRRSRGARICRWSFNRYSNSLSGTPAEAGVRGDSCPCYRVCFPVSVEPPPKQGCEHSEIVPIPRTSPSQWNPRRSRGARSRRDSKDSYRVSQWNPRRSRGARACDVDP